MPHDTCNFEICALRKKLKMKSPWECPNYIETGWVDDKQKNYTTKDCSPRRTAVSINEILARILTLQKTDEESRNVGVDLINTMSDAVNIISENPEARLNIKFSGTSSLPLLPKQ